MKEKTIVRFLNDDQYGGFKKGETGYVEGFVRGGNEVPLICIVTGNKIVLADFHEVEVLN